MELNGQVVGDELFTPGWTAYLHRLQYQTYDVTGLLRRGANCVGVILGDGWYRGRLVWQDRRNLYGEKVALLAQIEVEYQNGRREIISTDRTWKALTGPILKSDIYDGELYDVRRARLNLPRNVREVGGRLLEIVMANDEPPLGGLGDWALASVLDVDPGRACAECRL